MVGAQYGCPRIWFTVLRNPVVCVVDLSRFLRGWGTVSSQPLEHCVRPPWPARAGSGQLVFPTIHRTPKNRFEGRSGPNFGPPSWGPKSTKFDQKQINKLINVELLLQSISILFWSDMTKKWFDKNFVDKKNKNKLLTKNIFLSSLAFIFSYVKTLFSNTFSSDRVPWQSQKINIKFEANAVSQVKVYFVS